jgi:hypothetical protein
MERPSTRRHTPIFVRRTPQVKRTGKNPIAAFSAIGQFGTYDFQRDNGIFYSAYTNASNYAACVYMAGAGYSYDATIAIAVAFASLFSSNAGAESQTTWWTKGWNDATNGVGPCSRPQHD